MKKLLALLMIAIGTFAFGQTPDPFEISTGPAFYLPQVENPQIVMPNFFGNIKFSDPMANASITSRFGYRSDIKIGPEGGGDSIHLGIDIIPKDFSYKHVQILSAADGVVVIVYPAPHGKYKGHIVFGGCVQIQHDTGMLSAAGKPVYAYTLYGHMKDVWVYEGQKVKQGQAIGLMGATGQAEGAHLHFEISFDPLDFLDIPMAKGF